MVFGADMVTRFAASNKCIWYLYQEEIPKDAVKLKKMKNKREDRFEAIVDQFVKNDLIAQEEYSYYLYGVKHLEVLIMTTGGVLLSGILVKGDIVYSRYFLITIFTIKNRMARDTCENENKMFLLFVTVIFKWNLCKKQ